MDVELKVSESEVINLSSFQKFDDGSGWCVVVNIKSGHFSCSDVNLYFNDLNCFYRELKLIYENLKGSAQLKTNYEDNNISFKATSLGHIELTGMLREGNQSFNFHFEFDQSYLPDFLQQIEAVLEYK
jgi:hypothetical protein